MWLARSLSSKPTQAPKAQQIPIPPLADQKKSLFDDLGDVGCVYWDARMPPHLPFFPDLIPVSPQQKEVPRFQKHSGLVSFFIRKSC